MRVEALAKNIRISPRKARLVVDTIRGKSVLEAEHILMFMPKRGGRMVLTLLRSAIANAEHQYQSEKKTLFVTKVTANEGTVMKRFRARAFGSGAPIRKRTSHVYIVLEDQPKKIVSRKSKMSNNISEEPLLTTPKKMVISPSAKERVQTEEQSKKSFTSIRNTTE